MIFSFLPISHANYEPVSRLGKFPSHSRPNWYGGWSEAIGLVQSLLQY